MNKIVIKGGFGYTNFGDDALMYVIYTALRQRYSQNDIALLCKDDMYIEDILGEKVVIYSTDADYAIETKNLIYGGGTQFYSFPLTMARNVPRAGRIKELIFKPKELAQVLIKRILSSSLQQSVTATKKCSVGIGLGPFVSNSQEITEAEAIFKKLDYVAVRDKISYKLCKEWKIENLFYGADLCYHHAVEDQLDFSVKESKAIDYIGIIIRDWNHSSEGDIPKDSMMQYVDKIRNLGKKVRFISFAKDKDIDWIDFLTKAKEDILIWNANNTLRSFLTELNEFDTFITARYHGGIFASLLNKPSIYVRVEPKLELFGELVGQKEYVWKPNTSVSLLHGMMENLEHNFQELKVNMQKAVDLEKDKAGKMIQNLFTVIES